MFDPSSTPNPTSEPRKSEKSRLAFFFVSGTLVVLLILSLHNGIILTTHDVSSSRRTAEIARVETTSTAESLPSVYFTKVPKTGGTTISLILQRYAHEHNFSVALPPHPRWGKATCTRYPKSNSRAFTKLLATGSSPPRVFASQACAHSDYSKRYSLKIGIIREPFDRLRSSYAYAVERCRRSDPLLEASTKRHACQHTFEANALYKCGNYKGSCSIQAMYLGGSLEKHDLVMVTELFDESLVLLHILYGIPFDALHYVVANRNDLDHPDGSSSSLLDDEYADGLEHVPPQRRRRLSKRRLELTSKAQSVVSNGLSLDYALYRSARQRLLRRIAKLPRSARFQEKLAELRRRNAVATEACGSITRTCALSSRFVRNRRSR